MLILIQIKENAAASCIELNEEIINRIEAILR